MLILIRAICENREYICLTSLQYDTDWMCRGFSLLLLSTKRLGGGNPTNKNNFKPYRSSSALPVVLLLILSLGLALFWFYSQELWKLVTSEQNDDDNNNRADLNDCPAMKAHTANNTLQLRMQWYSFWFHILVGFFVLPSRVLHYSESEYCCWA